LEHPNILSIYAFGQQENEFYIVTRHVERGRPQDRLPPALSPQQAQEMKHLLGGAVDYAHSQRVVVTVVPPTREQIVVSATPEPGGEQPAPPPPEERPNPELTEEPAQ
jgi:hypothetical protein